MHTTCVATLLNGGHANNALPQRANANINCRIFPGTTPRQVRAKLQELVADPEIKVTAQDKRSEVPKGPQPLTPEVIEAGGTAWRPRCWPGVPVVPQHVGGRHRRRLPDPGGHSHLWRVRHVRRSRRQRAHGLNERIRVQGSVYDGPRFPV